MRGEEPTELTGLRALSSGALDTVLPAGSGVKTLNRQKASGLGEFNQ